MLSIGGQTYASNPVTEPCTEIVNLIWDVVEQTSWVCDSCFINIILYVMWQTRCFVCSCFFLHTTTIRLVSGHRGHLEQ